MVKVATTKAQRKLFFNLRRMKRNLAWLTEEETRNVARDLGVAPEEVREMEQRLTARDTAFDLAADHDDEEGSYAPALYLPAPDADPAVQVEREEWEGATSDALSRALAQLDERSRRIILARWMTAEKKTLTELADSLGVSAERVRQIEAGALQKLRTLMAGSA
jgi:RNA polymerase sigma-32 factor